jgi:glycosyltransferase involved in cell wall biosynthesis
MEKLLSVVIPVYEVEPYIRQCLSSLLVPETQRQLMDVVIINDGTKDNSARIAREYEVAYPGIFRVFDQENRGHGGAWNHGTELATGKYLYYLDSDDWFDTEEFGSLITYLERVDVDMVLMDRTICRVQENREEQVVLRNMIPGKVYDADVYDWLYSGNGSNITYAHNTVYRSEMMRRYLPLFCEKVMYDDILLQVMPIMVARNFVYTPLNVYRYRSGRPGQSYDPAVRIVRFGDVTTVVKHLLGFIKDHRDEIPHGGTRRMWTDAYYSRFCSWHYRELAQLPYGTSRLRMADWDAFVRSACPDADGGWEAWAYRHFPFCLAYLGLRMSVFAGKGMRVLKKLAGR